MFRLTSNVGYRWYNSVHGQWMTISYLWVLETNTGATWRTGYLRIVSPTLVLLLLYQLLMWSIYSLALYVALYTRTL